MLASKNSPHRTHYIARPTYPSSPLYYALQIYYLYGMCWLLIGSFWYLDRSSILSFMTQREDKNAKKSRKLAAMMWGNHIINSLKNFTQKLNHTTILTCELWAISDINIPFCICRIWASSAEVGVVLSLQFVRSIFFVYCATGLLGDPKDTPQKYLETSNKYFNGCGLWIWNPNLTAIEPHAS